MRKGKQTMADVVSNPNDAMVSDVVTDVDALVVPTHIVHLQSGMIGWIVVREHPEKETSPVSLVREGSLVNLLETDMPDATNWLKIEHDGQVGYVSADLVTVEEYHDETV